MTERKPRDITFRSWIDQQISEAEERGAFDNLPGTGKPLPNRGDAENAWLIDWMRREGISTEELLPTPLRLRKQSSRLARTVHEMGSEQEVRDAVAELNYQIVEWRRIPSDRQYSSPWWTRMRWSPNGARLRRRRRCQPHRRQRLPRQPRCPRPRPSPIRPRAADGGASTGRLDCQAVFRGVCASGRAEICASVRCPEDVNRTTANLVNGTLHRKLRGRGSIERRDRV